MNLAEAEKWLKNLRDYWFNKDVEKVVSLFQNTTYYQESPFMEPYTCIEEIKADWEHIKSHKIQDIKLNVLAIDGNTLIAQWQLKQNDMEYDGIYEIKFNEKLECVYFKSWEMIK